MAKAKSRKPKRQVTDWNVGQPLVFPKKRSAAVIERLAQEVLTEAMRGLKVKRPKRKKK